MRNLGRQRSSDRSLIIKSKARRPVESPRRPARPASVSGAIVDSLVGPTPALTEVRRQLHEKTIALKQILEHLEDERDLRRRQVIGDLRESILPILACMRKMATGDLARQVEKLESRLKEILEDGTDSFRGRLEKLTPRELEVCELIKQGLSSKEIATRLNVSLLTVHKHRETIRKKLGIANKEMNLSTYLRFRLRPVPYANVT